MISTASNYQEIIQAITLFDMILSVNTQAVSDFDIPSSTSSIVNHLLSDAMRDKFDPFIYQSFKLFMDKKTNITVDMSWINKIDDANFLRLIFGESGCKKFEYERDEHNKKKSNDNLMPSENTNIPFVSKQFRNVETIRIINTTYHSISLFSMLTLLEPQSAIEKIEIQIEGDEHFGHGSRDLSIL